MNIELCEEALEFGSVAKAALGSAGGDDLAPQMAAAPDRRESTVGAVLGELGAWGLDVRGSTTELEAAAAVCRAVGYWGLPYPVGERLSRPTDLDVTGLSVVTVHRPAAAISGLGLPWAAVTLDGVRWSASPRSGGGPDTAFVDDLDLSRLDDGGARDLPLALVLPCWTLLGQLDRAIELTCDYARDRQQFGQPLAAFQGVQFQLTDAEVERTGLEELAKYALWSVAGGRGDALADALAVRLAAIEAADIVFRVCHQVHGAIGFCDESTLSWVSRNSHPIRRYPLSQPATRRELARVVGGFGLSGLFDEVAV